MIGASVIETKGVEMNCKQYGVTYIFICIIVNVLLSGCLSRNVTSSIQKEINAHSSKEFNFPKVNPKHRHVNAMLANSMRFINPKHKMMDPLSGYPVEGWNHDPKSGLYLRSFTQLTAIGEWLELMANIAAGYADNPYVTRKQAIVNLELATKSLLLDQINSKLSAKGLLGNFLGLEWDGRVGPLSSDVSKEIFVKVFGKEKSEKIWEALQEKKWIKLIKDGEEAEVLRSSTYGSKHFDGPLKEFNDDEAIEEIMDILDERVVKIIYGDNANLTASVAKTIGALMHPNLKNNKKASKLRLDLEKFIENQRVGYEFLYDKKTHSFIFGWDATKDKFVGWENDKGEYNIAHMGYMVNEFRGPTIFAVLRYGIPMDAIRCMWFVIKSHTMNNGEDKFTLCSWDGSAFQGLGLSLFMRELQNPIQKKILRDLVDIEIDYSSRNGLPGFLSESYTGYKNQYTGSVGISDIAATKEERIITAPSMYTMGVAYMVAPEKMEKFMCDNWSLLSILFTDHGPWEGYNVAPYKNDTLMSILTLGLGGGKIIKFQTSAHLFSFVLGVIGSAPENMERYLKAHKLTDKLASFYKPGKSVNFLADGNKAISWTIDGSKCDAGNIDKKLHLKGDDVGVGGVTLQSAKSAGFDLAGGILTIKYRSAYQMDDVQVIIKRLQDKGVPIPEIDITAIVDFKKSPDKDQIIGIPLPAAPALRRIKEIIILYGEEKPRSSIDLTFSKLEFQTTAVNIKDSASISATVQDSKQLKILFIGNSYTSQIKPYFIKIVQAHNREAEIDWITFGGRKLREHAEQRNVYEQIKRGNYNVVVLQDQSQTPTFPDYFEKNLAAIKKLNNAIAESGAKTVLYMTWGRKNGDIENKKIFPNDNYEKMQQRLIKGYEGLASELNAKIAPVGLTWKKLVDKMELYKKDGSHPNMNGGYLAACVIYYTIFGTS